ALDALLAAGQQHAEAAVRARPGDAEGHFSLARAAGRRALSVGVRDRVRLSRIIRDEALAALKINSAHPGALHVLGMWNAELMRVGGLSRMFARTFLGADVFNLASWDEAQRLLEAAVQYDPGRIVHRLDLAGIYADRGDAKRARELYVWIASAPIVEPNDDLYKRQAAERLKRLANN
ncbi:MAG: tetratricopeptide repeat protein, partial [Vicinamibacterales bacterium]